MDKPSVPGLAHKHFVKSKIISGFLLGAALQGYEPKFILQKAGLGADLFQQHDRDVSGSELHKLLSVLAQELDDSFMGFMTHPTKLAMGHFIAQQLAGSKTLKDVINARTHFREIVRDDIHFEQKIDPADHSFTISLSWDLRPEVDHSLFYWYRLWRFYRSFCHAIGQRIKLKHVDFAGAASANLTQADYDLFNCEVRFNQPVSCLCFDSGYLDCRVFNPFEELTEDGDIFTIPETEVSWTGQVKAILLVLQQQDIWWPPIDKVAEHLPINARALRRQLARENETFLSIKGQVRRELACEWLKAVDKPIAHIAERLGYTEPAAFSRAFKLWTGSSPSAYREKYARKT